MSASRTAEAIIPTKVDSMGDLYARLAAKGFDRSFLQEAILPEWWDDTLAVVPANRAFAEDLFARNLGMTLADLGDPSADLRLPFLTHVKFKRHKNRVDERLAPALLIAQRAAKIIVGSLSLPPFTLDFDSSSVRQEILRQRRYVDLASLLEFCWNHGIVVFHLAKTPKQSKPFDGLAMFCGDRPVLVLGSRRDSPAWLAFHLAHELSHVIRRHVTAGSPPLADSDLQASSTDKQEKEADAAALELLTGSFSPRVKDLKYNASRLAVRAAEDGPTLGVDPGVMTLIYAKSNDRWPVAQIALKHLSLASGAQELISAALRKRFNPEDLSESSERFLSVVSI